MHVDVFQDVDQFVWSSEFIARHSTNKEDIREQAFAGLDLRACREILDLGCAFGFSIPPLKERVHPDAQITGIDLCAHYHELFINSSTKANLSGKFLAADISILDEMPADRFDLVICSYALYFFPEAIPAIARVIRPDGIFIALTHAEGHMSEIINQARKCLQSQGKSPLNKRTYLERMTGSFSDQNGQALLSPWFGEIQRKIFQNSLTINLEDLPELIRYIRFKYSFLVPEHPGTQEEILEQIERRFRRELRQNKELLISKHDAVFICAVPRRKSLGENERKHRLYCPHCTGSVAERTEKDGTIRDYCEKCDTYFYDNPLPVVSTILVQDRQVLLVRRKNRPYRGKWCLPSGFVERGEDVTEAALRELEEETGIEGRIISLVHADTTYNYFYGDLLFLTFEAEQVGGTIEPRDDAEEVKFFPIENTPRLAFTSNNKALNTYCRQKRESWAIADSFASALDEADHPGRLQKSRLSDSLVRLIEDNAEKIVTLWIAEVTTNKSTLHYHALERQDLTKKILEVTAHFGKWLEGSYAGRDIRTHYTELGRERYKEGFPLSEVISALSLIRKHIWQYARAHGMWKETIDIYMILELEMRIMLFFDRAAYCIVRGYEEEQNR